MLQVHSREKFSRNALVRKKLVWRKSLIGRCWKEKRQRDASDVHGRTRELRRACRRCGREALGSAAGRTSGSPGLVAM
jgi:hypothetical protein